MSWHPAKSSLVRRALPPQALLALLLVAPAVQAGVTSCMVSATGPVFGTYTPMQGAALTSTGTVTTVCVVTSHSNTITIGLSPGYSGNFGTREMTALVGGTTYTLNYNLYLNVADTQIWGDGSGPSLLDTVTLTRHGNQSTITTNSTVYGQIPALQDPVPGAYTDTITVTVTF
jgi:spore coat protein U-like protein